MCFLFAETKEKLQEIINKAIECGHCIVSKTDKPLTNGQYMILTIPPGDSTW